MKLIKRTLKLILYMLLFLVSIVITILVISRLATYFRENQTPQSAAPATGTFVQAHDLTLFIQEAGPKNDHAYVFINGFGAWSETWKSTMNDLATQNIRSIAIDMPPFGYSERPQDLNYTRETQAKRILAVLEATNVSTATLVGHSYGGGSTMEATLLAPDKITSLVLVNVALGLTDPPTQPDTFGKKLFDATFSIRPVRNAVLSATATNPLLSKTLLNTFIADPDSATPEKVAVYQRTLSLKNSTNDLGDWLQKDLLAKPSPSLSTNIRNYQTLTIPTLIIWGDKDTIPPLTQGEHLHKNIPNSQLKVLQGIGHIPQLEDTVQFNRVLKEFALNL